MRYVLEMRERSALPWEPIARFAALGDAYAFFRHRAEAARGSGRRLAFRVRRGERTEYRTDPPARRDRPEQLQLDAATRERLRRELC